MTRAALSAALSLALAACASAPPKLHGPPSSGPAAAGSSSTPYVAHPLSGERERMIDTAASMLGQPYRFGGAAPGGFDCSGLVVYAAANAGIRVPRTAAEQLRFGSPVKRAELQAGDLVFMHLSSKELHVAIALDRQLFVHSPSSGGRVRVDSLLAQPYAKAFIAARRVVSFDTPQ